MLVNLLIRENEKMPKQDAKPWYKSKTKWAGILGAALMVVTNPTPVGIGQGVVALLGVFGVRDALDAR